jgi:hypothetical protein
MAYVRRKQVKGNTYYQLVESYRDGGKVRQRLVAHLGAFPTLEEAIAGHRDYATKYREWALKRRWHRDCLADDDAREAFIQAREKALRKEAEPDLAAVHARALPMVERWAGRAREALADMLADPDRGLPRWWEQPRPEPPAGGYEWQVAKFRRDNRELLRRWRILDEATELERGADEHERKAMVFEQLTRRSA